MQPSFFVAVVDPAGEFGRTVEATLKAGTPEALVVSYEHADQFLQAIQKAPLRVPLVVVADIAARTPSVREGIFSRTRQLVPRTRGVYFSTEPSIEVCQEMLGLGLLGDIVRRDEESRLANLRQAVSRIFAGFELSLEYKLISRFAQRISTLPDLSDSDASMASQILAEMTRGTHVGLDYLDSFAQRHTSWTLATVGNRDADRSFKNFLSHLLHSGHPSAQLEDGRQGMEANNGKYMDVLKEISEDLASGYQVRSAEKELLFSVADQIGQGWTRSDIPETVVRGSEEYEAQQRSLKPVSEASAEELIEPGGLLARFMGRQQLGIWGFLLRPLLRKTARDAFVRMQQYYPESLRQYGQFFVSDRFPEEREGWRVFKSVYEELLLQTDTS
jgi:hypothetical protein